MATKSSSYQNQVLEELDKIPVDKSLNFFNDKVLFPEKLEKANEMLKKVGLPMIETQPTNQENP